MSETTDTDTTTDTTGGSISDILTNIQNLQDTEKDLISQLDLLTSTPGYDSAAATSLVAKINNIADARMSMFNTISANATVIQSGVADSRVELVSQLTLYQVVEDQLNKAKAQLDSVNTRNDTKLRLVEINTYYGQRYEAQSNLMKKIILVCLPVLIIFIFKKKGFIPEMIANYLLGIIIAVGAILIIRNVWDIYTRSNMDFNAYDWNYEVSDPSTQAPSVMEYNKKNLFNFDNMFGNLMTNLGICVGSQCCAPGLVFDKTKQQCVSPSTAPSANAIAYAKQAAAAKAAAAKAAAAGVATFVGGRGQTAGSSTQGFTSGSGLQGTVVATYFNDTKNAVNGIVPFSYDTAYAAV